jgi:hypothetical protein
MNMTGTVKQVAPLNLAKLRRDMQTIMDEIDRTGGVLPDAYSPVMWQRLQNATENVATAIQAVRLSLSGMSHTEIAAKLGLKPQQVAAYAAWNTMLQPDWVSPRGVVASTPCPKCGASQGEDCMAVKIHRVRRDAAQALVAAGGGGK